MLKIKNKRIVNILLILLVLSLSTITSVGYAALSQDLSISGDIAYEKKENIICKRATILHTEECNNTVNANWGCRGNNHALGDTILYGSLGINDTTLTSGDAFDCDVNGDGTYDAETERFYYVSGLDGDSTSEYATLIYYTNVSGGVVNNADAFIYYSTTNNNHGPSIAYQQLPSIEQWPNTSLSNIHRQLYTEKNAIKSGMFTLDKFSYIDKAARLLSYKEVNAGCGITIGNTTTGELNNCEYLMEHTGYSTNDSTFNVTNWWLESPTDSYSTSAWTVFGRFRSVKDYNVTNTSGVRPAIEVKKSQIDLKMPPKKCRRATELHTEECDRTSDGCYATGYYSGGSKNTTTITYGSLGTSGTLTSGDAFDCDVNGDGTYDAETERFYYVSGLDGDNTSDYATLIYYTNVSSGTPNDTARFAYYSADKENWHGPETSYLQLPIADETAWKNVSLSNQTRQIYAENNATSTSGGTLPQFTYTDRAARLLSHKEVNLACGITIGSRTIGELDSCEYFLEHTSYSTSKTSVNASYWWLESPYSSRTYDVWIVIGNKRRVFGSEANIDSGVRPAIEVLKTDIDY